MKIAKKPSCKQCEQKKEEERRTRGKKTWRGLALPSFVRVAQTVIQCTGWSIVEGLSWGMHGSNENGGGKRKLLTEDRWKKKGSKKMMSTGAIKWDTDASQTAGIRARHCAAGCKKT